MFPLERQRRRGGGGDNFKLDLRETDCDNGNWTGCRDIMQHHNRRFIGCFNTDCKEVGCSLTDLLVHTAVQ